jgi:hypothetical protein
MPAMGDFKTTNYVRLLNLGDTFDGKLAKIRSPLDGNGRYTVELQEPVNPELIRPIITVTSENLVRACNHCHKVDVPTMPVCGKCKNAA